MSIFDGRGFLLYFPNFRAFKKKFIAVAKSSPQEEDCVAESGDPCEVDVEMGRKGEDSGLAALCSTLMCSDLFINPRSKVRIDAFGRVCRHVNYSIYYKGIS